ncbi:hypothetical protein [Paenibacillus thailandensis]|uniref:Beta-ketoacyl synthase N-terminal domain-containing protein n=1 Tax=Paenibacillus thailandensis TaxID=393250 RepID=A0ABW5R2V2_9BACL
MSVPTPYREQPEEEDQIVEILPSGAKVIIIGTPSVENCKEFWKILLKAKRESEGKGSACSKLISSDSKQKFR